MTDNLHLQDQLSISISDADAPPQDSLSLLLDEEDDESIDSLIPDPPKSRKKVTNGDRASLLASMPKVEWWATRRVLYVVEARCRHCGSVYQMPSESILTEFVTSDGRKKWAKQQIPDDPTMQPEVETLRGQDLQQCPECLS